jgi:hypothetical protein
MRVLGAVFAVAVLGAAPAGADPVGCGAAIARAGARYAQVASKAVARCRDRVLRGRLPPSTACRNDAHLPAAAARLAAAVAAACCGADGVCGTGDDETLAAVGWDVGQCPDLEHVGCTGALAGMADVAPCVACVATAAADRLFGFEFDPLAPSAEGSTLRTCQATLGKETARFFRKAAKVLQRCWDARSRGLHGNVCPDPGDGKAAPALAVAAARTSARLCAACGGADGACGGGDDLAPAAIGTLAHCPAVEVPDGPACAAPIASLADLVGCVGCLARFHVACTDRLAEPAFVAYPAACNPPAGTCSAGVACETTLDCPAGLDCRDNGGGTRYCVGPACTLDADCGDGAVCRQYCTRDGCGPRQCQCPGFACGGVDELCLDDGGLACRKLCTQDSDCTGQSGLVCVNPGFGFGVCIGSAPCE